MGMSGKRRVVLADLEKKVWNESSLPFGVLRRIVNHDPDTGALSLVVDVPPGWASPDHWNSSDMELLVLDGDFTVAGRECGRGHYIYLPSGTSVGPMSSDKGATLIWWIDSDFEIQTGPAPAPAAPVEETTDVFDPANWETVRDAFEGVTDTTSHAGLEVPTRCIRLRRSETSGMDTILFVMPPNFSKTALEFHHSTEEIFFLGGWCATDPEHVYEAGTYLCWEPGVIHGVVCGWEAICISKHHGPLTSPEIPLGAVSVDAQLQ